MLNIMSIFIPAITAADTIGIGMAAGLCEKFNKNYSRAVRLAIMISIIHSIMFISGHMISTININSDNFFSFTRSVYPFFLMIIGIKFLYSGFSNRKQKNTKIHHITITYLLIIVSGIDEFGAGFSIPNNFFIIALAFSCFFTLNFTIIGFFISNTYIKKIGYKKSPDFIFRDFTFGSIAIFAGIITLI